MKPHKSSIYEVFLVLKILVFNKNQYSLDLL